MKNYYFIFTTIILILCFFNTVYGVGNIQPSNNQINISELDGNQYEGYATFDGFSRCNFRNRYSFPKLVSSNPIITTNTPTEIQFLYTQFVLHINFTIPYSDNPLYYIVNVDSAGLSTSFIFNFTCKDINENNLNISLINDRANLLENGVSYFYISIKGLEYKINNLLDLTSLINSTISVISKEFYLIRYDLWIMSSLDMDIMVQIKTKLFRNSVKSAIDTTKFQTIQDQSYPVINATSPYEEYSKGISPIVTFTTNLTQSTNYFISIEILSETLVLPRLISQVESNGTLYNKYILPLVNFNNEMSYSYILYYYSGLNRNQNMFSVFYIASPIYQVPKGSLTIQNGNIFVLNFDSTSYPYSNSPFKFNYYSYELITQFPFGFISSSSGIFTFSASFYAQQRNVILGDKFSIVEYPWGTIPTEYLDNNPDTIDDSTIPNISLLKIIPVIGFKYLLVLSINTPNGISKIKALDGLNYKSFGLETLVNGTSTFGSYEIILDDISTIKFLQVIDIFGNSATFYEFDTVFQQTDLSPVLLESPIQQVDIDISNVTFFINDMDVLNKPCYNTIYFSSKSIPQDYPLQFRLLDPVSYSSSTSLEGNQDPVPIRFSKDLGLFYCDFIVPKNTLQGIVPYEIISPFVSVHSSLISKTSNITLRISNSKLDNDGPIISAIKNGNRDGYVGWEISIIDEVNGFSKGYIKAVGSVDFSSFSINFTFSNANRGSTIYNGTYLIKLNDIQTPCIPQEYTIEYIYLEDSNKRISRFSRFDPKIQPENNPLRLFLADLSSGILKSSTLTCTTIVTDSSPPVIKVNSYSLNLDVGSNNRVFSISFEVSDSESPLMTSQLPIVYLMASNYELAQSESKLLNVTSNNSSATYESIFNVPYSLGFPNYLLLSIYGAINSQGLYGGYFDTNIDQIIPSYGLEPILFSYEPIYYYSNAEIIIYGKLLESSTLVSIKFSNGTLGSYGIKTIISQSAIVFEKGKDDIIVGPFEVTVYYGIPSRTTNTITVYPIYYNKTESSSYYPNPTYTPSVTTTPAPTNKPQKCLGTPECGGKDHGYCVENQGCVCYSPFIGKDCSSQIIVVPQPTVNNSVPSVEIPVIDDNSNSDEIDNIFYKSLISLVSLRELDINNKEVKNHPFILWSFNQVNSTTSTYLSNISVTDKSGVKQQINVIATIMWFENETFLEFANQNLTMNPSSIKYTIEITNYPFLSNLNRLQLVMSASIVSSKTEDTCSAKEFGDTTTGDNSNYLQIQIENKSLYGRFIKRGIINNGKTIVALDNELLDSKMNSISNPNEIQSYIGITIPYFEEGNAIIDPDFSVLLNSNSANSICTKSKLSNSKIIGIVIGCFVFLCSITVAVIYTIHKTKKKKKFLKTMSQKLNEMN